MPENHTDHDDFGGLDRDLPRLVGRREALMWMGGVSLAGVLAACGFTTSAETSTTTPSTTTGGVGSSSTAAPTTTSGQATTTTELASTITATPGAEIPDEAGGPFPADGTNGPNVLDIDGVMRTDLASSFGPFSGTAEGVPTTLALTVVDASTGSPLSGAVVYLWHCTADGRYSIYEVADQNYLRGLQVADDAGRLAFSTVFPGCYPGRWPHAHFEVYASLEEATSGRSSIKTSQLAFPEADCVTVYADDRYGNSAQDLARLSLASDIVFADGWADQLAVVSGTVENGLTAALLVRV